MLLLWDWLLLGDLQIHHRWTQTQSFELAYPVLAMDSAPLSPDPSVSSPFSQPRAWLVQGGEPPKYMRYRIKKKAALISPLWTGLFPKLFEVQCQWIQSCQKKKCLLTWFSLIHVDAYIGERKIIFILLYI